MHAREHKIPNMQKIQDIMNMQEQRRTIIQNTIHVRQVMTHIIPRHAVKNAANTNPATQSSMQRPNPIIQAMSQTIAQNRKNAQRPHPTTIAKMIRMVIPRTTMLSMKSIIGTITKPNQLIQMAEKK